MLVITMDKLQKWAILSRNIAGKKELDRLSCEYLNIDDNDPRLHTPEAVEMVSTLEKPPVDATVLAYPDAAYPPGLRQLRNPPPILYVLGTTDVLSAGPCVAVVGSRSASAYGMTVTADFCRDFCEAGFTIVTGGAKGVDSAAAQTALKFGGKVILVLGCGVDVVYPPENEDLFRQTTKAGGAIVSEFIYGTQPLSSLFPRRNRIIAALSDGCVVTEAGLRSGALITADHCLDLRRPLYAVPGNITSAGSAGTNSLIRSGALMATDGMQVASELKLALSFAESGIRRPNTPSEHTGEKRHSEKPTPSKPSQEPPQKILGLSADEEKIVAAIHEGGSSPAEISAKTGFDEAVLAPMLVMLELRGVIERRFGGKYDVK